MSVAQLESRVFPRRPGGPARTAVLCAALLAAASGCTRQTTDSGTGISVQAAVAELEQGHARGVLRIKGIVTGDDPSVDQTLVADDTRGILVPHAPWVARPTPGSRVVLEGQLRMGEGSIPTLTVSRVVSVTPGTMPEAVLIEAG